MPLAVHTAHASYPGPARLDVSRRTGDDIFAPSLDLVRAACGKDGWRMPWNRFADYYTQEMRQSYRRNRPAWDALLGGKRVVLVCYCNDPSRCHRTVLGQILAKLGAKFYGEITEWDATIEEPVFARGA